MKKLSKVFLAGFLILVASLFRTLIHLGPNIEFVTTASFLAAAYLGGFWAWAVPLATMIFTDKLIGNNYIFIFTWSAFMIIGLVDSWFLQRSGRKKLIFKQTGLGIAASLFFYFYTNFGVWLLDFFGMYPKTFSGLLTCYWMGLPFLRFNLLGNLFFIPLAFVISERLYAIIRLWGKFYHSRKSFLATR